MGAASGFNIGSIGGDFSLRAGGDIVAGNKTTVNNIIQRLVKQLTSTPYKFLTSYDIADRDIFYGRTAVVEELAGEMERHKVIIINGASGAGKSSLVNAGLIPRLTENGYSYIAFREYSDPLTQFNQLGKPPATSSLQGTEVNSDGQAAQRRTMPALTFPPGKEVGATQATEFNDPRLLLQFIRALKADPIIVVLDQFERFFVNVPFNKRSAFIAGVKHCLDHSTTQEINFVIGLRDEFFGQLTREFEAQIPIFLNEAFHLNLLPLTIDEAREAIVRPLENTGLQIQYHKIFVDQVLLTGLAAQGEQRTGINPPHLQIVCNQLFDAARQRLQQEGSVLIDEKLYDELGGVQTILSTYLDKVVEETAHAPERIHLVRAVLQRMIDTTGTRRFVTDQLLERELPNLDEAEIHTVTQALLDRRVVEERSRTYSLSHEYMVQQVKEWFDPIEMERKRAQETLERGLAERTNSQALLNRTQVEAIRKWVNVLGAEEQKLLQDSEADYLKREREEAASKSFRRGVVRIGTGFAIAAFVIVSVLGVISFKESKSARASLARAQIAQSHFLASLSQQATDAGNGTDAILLGLEALPKNMAKPDRPYVVEAEAALLRAVQENWIERDLQGHTGLVSSAAFSPDGTRIVTASWDNTARVWDTPSGGSLAVLQGHTGPVNWAAFSPGGTRIVTASDDNTARVWDTFSGRSLAVLQGHTGPVNWAAFSPDGTRIVTASGDETARVWDAASGRSLAVLQGHTDWVHSAAFSPDGTRIVTASKDDTARVWDAASGRSLAVLQGHTDQVFSAAFSPDGAHIVTASKDETARVWDAASGRSLAVLQGHTGWVFSPAFSPDGTRIVTASDDDTARVWDAASGRCLVVLQGHTGRVVSAAFSPDGAHIVTASGDKTARVWDTASARSLVVLQGHTGQVESAAFSPDGTRVVTASADKTARVWDAPWFRVRVNRNAPITLLGHSLVVLQGHTDGVNSAAFNPDGTRIVTASDDNTARVWDAASGHNLAVLQGHTRTVYSAAFSADGARIVTASYDNTARVWDAASGRSLAVLQGHTGGVISAAFSPDGTRIVTASEDKTARLWDAASGRSLAVLQGHTERVGSAAFSPDGARIVTASNDDTARVWDIASGRSLAVLKDHTDRVNSAAFSADGARIVTASNDNTARVWDIASGRSLAVLKDHTDRVNSAAFSADGTRIVTASNDKTARMWRTFPNTQSLIDYARATVPRQLTEDERQRVFLDPAPPLLAAGKTK